MAINLLNTLILSFSLNIFCSEVEHVTFPWLVSLFDRGGHFCLGSIVSNRIVVTSASCVDGKSDLNFRIRVGSQQYLTGGELLSLIQVIIHEDYNQDPSEMFHRSDLAILVTEDEIHFNKNVKSVPITVKELQESDNALVMGWRTNTDQLSFELNFNQVTVLSERNCIDLLDNYFRKNKMICTRQYNEESLCRGDIGGPLIINETLYGVLSGGSGCAPPDVPAVFTAVHYYRQWIIELIEKFK